MVFKVDPLKIDNSIKRMKYDLLSPDQKLINSLSKMDNEDDIVNIVWSTEFSEISLDLTDEVLDRVIKNHIANRDTFVNSSHIVCSDNIHDTEVDYIFDLFLDLPKTYIDKFKKADPELFYNIINKETIKLKPQGRDTASIKELSSLSFIQNYYLRVSRLEPIENAINLLKEFSSEILAPAREKMIGVNTNTDIFEYFLKHASSQEESAWDFMAPLTSMFDTFNERQQNIFTAIGVSEFFNDLSDQDNIVLNYKSDQYTNTEVLISLDVVPYNILKDYVNNPSIKEEAQTDLQNLLLSKKLQTELSPKPIGRKMKI